MFERAALMGINDSEVKIILDILDKHLPNCEVFAYGSRAKGNFKPWSDLDLAVKSPENLDFLHIARIKEDFMESDLPFRVDIINFNAIKGDAVFRENITKSYIKIKG